MPHVGGQGEQSKVKNSVRGSISGSRPMTDGVPLQYKLEALWGKRNGNHKICLICLYCQLGSQSIQKKKNILNARCEQSIK